jgi:phospholipid transport system substrate-binding protein
MKLPISSLFLIFGLTSNVAQVETAAETARLEPKLQVEKLLSAIQEVPDIDKRSEAIASAHSTLDIAGLAKRSLGSHWKKLDAAAQNEFTNLLIKIFAVRVYPKSAEFFKKLNVSFGEEEVGDEKAAVNTSLTHPKEGRVDVAYKLRKQEDGGWKIYEVEMDEVPMGANLRSQIRKVLKKDGYDALLKKLQERIKEFEAEAK